MPISLFVVAAVADYTRSIAFADDLERCIREAAQHAAESFPRWGDRCLPATEKADVQASVLAQTITPFEAKWGYPAAVWCAFYATDLKGGGVDPDDPNLFVFSSPRFTEWYEQIVCPWDLTGCVNAPLGKDGDEHLGVPVATSTKTVKYLGERDRRTMSCGLCGHLQRKLGPPPLTVAKTSPGDAGREHAFSNDWNLYPVGVWIANEEARQGWLIEDTVAKMTNYRASDGEEINGMLSAARRRRPSCHAPCPHSLSTVHVPR